LGLAVLVAQVIGAIHRVVAMVVILQPLEQRLAAVEAAVEAAAAQSATTGQMEVLAAAEGRTQTPIQVAQALAPDTLAVRVMVAIIKTALLAAVAVLAALGATVQVPVIERVAVVAPVRIIHIQVPL